MCTNQWDESIDGRAGNCYNIKEDKWLKGCIYAMKMYKIPASLRYFGKFHWYLRDINAKYSEERKIIADIRSGLISRDMLEEGWQEKLTQEIELLRDRLRRIERTIEEIPESREMMPCKIFLRLHFVTGLSLTETAENMNVSETTLRRIRERTAKYFEKFPPEDDKTPQ